MSMLTSASALEAVAVKPTTATATAAARALLNLPIKPPRYGWGGGGVNVRPPIYASISEMGIRVTAATPTELRCTPWPHSLQVQATHASATCLHPAVRAPGYASSANCFYGRRRPALRLAMIRATADTSHAPVLRPMRSWLRRGTLPEDGSTARGRSPIAAVRPVTISASNHLPHPGDRPDAQDGSDA